MANAKTPRGNVRRGLYGDGRRNGTSDGKEPTVARKRTKK